MHVLDLQVTDHQTLVAREDEVGINKHRVHIEQPSPIRIAGEHLSDVLQCFAASTAVPAHARRKNKVEQAPRTRWPRDRNGGRGTVLAFRNGPRRANLGQLTHPESISPDETSGERGRFRTERGHEFQGEGGAICGRERLEHVVRNGGQQHASGGKCVQATHSNVTGIKRIFHSDGNCNWAIYRCGKARAAA